MIDLSDEKIINNTNENNTNIEVQDSQLQLSKQNENEGPLYHPKHQKLYPRVVTPN